MRYQKRLCIIFMQDNGPRRSFRVRRGRFFLVMTFFACLPLVCGFLGWQAWQLWRENATLRENMLRFESDYQEAQATAERLQNLEELLREAGVQGRELVLRKLASAEQAETPPHEADEPAPAPEGPAAMGEGPGHEEFPAIDRGYVKVGNVQARALHGSKLRIGLDLRNTDSQRLASGSVQAVLVTADGQKRPLVFEPDGVADFRISRFKRAVMVARLPEHLSLVNAQIILEVKSQNQGVVYRNIFAVER